MHGKLRRMWSDGLISYVNIGPNDGPQGARRAPLPDMPRLCAETTLVGQLPYDRREVCQPRTWNNTAKSLDCYGVRLYLVAG